MRLVTAVLVYVAVAAVTGLVLGMDAGGLSPPIAVGSLMAGAISAVIAFFAVPQLSESAAREPHELNNPFAKYHSTWKWLVAFVFALFAVRSFCWLYFYDGDSALVQSPNNLGDLGLHITYIKTFASGVSLWPDSPIFVFSKLRYPAGIDLFNGLFSSIGFDLRHQLVATGLVASIATFYMLYRWSGVFGVAGFLFNGGIIGYQFLSSFEFVDYQGAPNISWKSIPLSMFVTQRGWLYAIPAGLLLLWQWRVKYGEDRELVSQCLPAWVEYVIYATMPLFHVHTFLALNVVVVLLFLGRPESRRPLMQLAAAAFLPATFFVWLITDNFHAGTVFAWHWGWTQRDGEFKMPFFEYWFVNFGLFLPLVITLAGIVAWREWNTIKKFAIALAEVIRRREWKAVRKLSFELSMDTTLLVSAAIIFLLTLLVKTAPWEWDNIKILIWAYLISLPILWTRLIRPWPVVVRAGACILLFLSGFISLFGGLAAGQPGFGFASRSEVDVIGSDIRRLPVEARFAAYPTYNHPLLLNGRKVVCGYPGHLWTQAIEYGPVADKLQSLMLGAPDWEESARQLKVRYIFWGTEERRNYVTSSRPWESKLPAVVKGPWGAIYDLGK
jgi:hypothetical protein